MGKQKLIAGWLIGIILILFCLWYGFYKSTYLFFKINFVIIAMAILVKLLQFTFIKNKK
jgi:putative effector of murein hydrolase LrgA (UPF0299 family)